MVFLVQEIILAQESELDFLDKIEEEIDQHLPTSVLLNTINAYLIYCETNDCKQVSYVRFLDLSYTWMEINAVTTERMMENYKKDFPESIYLNQVDQLLQLNEERQEITEAYRQFLNDPSLADEYCPRYKVIGAFRQYCDYLSSDFEVLVTDTSSTEDYTIYQFTYRGHDYKAPEMKLLRGNGDGSLNVLSNNSSFASLQLPRDVFQEVSFTSVSPPYKKVSVVFNQELDANSQLAFDPQITMDNGIHFFNVKKAEGPFTVVFVDQELALEKEFIFPEHDDLSSEDLSKLVDPGSYELRVTDGLGNQSKAFFVKVRSQKSGFPWGLFIGVLSFALLFAGVFKAFKTGKKWKKPRAPKEALGAPITPVKLSEEAVSSDDTLTSKAVEDTLPPQEEKAALKHKISVSQVKTAGFSKKWTREEVDQSKASEEYIALSLDQLWDSSAVDEVLIKKEMIQKMDIDVRNEENMKKEIGGFLLGKYYQTPKGSYTICLEEYIDIEGEGQSEFQIGFGADAWSKLEDSLEEFQQYDLIGWFHTHPGHGVFLSRPDKNISNNFFNKPYQVAMEIDPLLRPENPNLDTSFFTQKTDGSLNNNGDVKDHWFSWSSIVKMSQT
jgi:proteasome lid subunit RPN8/RPN11